MRSDDAFFNRRGSGHVVDEPCDEVKQIEATVESVGEGGQRAVQYTGSDAEVGGHGSGRFTPGSEDRARPTACR